MDPITVSTATVVLYLVRKLKDKKSVQDFFNDFTDATINWIKPLFIQVDGEPQKVIKELQEKPDSVARQDAVKSTIAVAIEDNSTAQQLLKQLVEQIEKKDPSFTKTNTINLTGGGNKIYQDINQSAITDSSVNQTHSGSGDNVGRDKIS